MKKLLSVIIGGIVSTVGFAQLSGTYNIPGAYPTLDAAINDLNLQGVSGPVTFSIVGPYSETAPAGGYTITATGTSANPITITASGGATITAYSGGTGTPGTAVQDGVFHVVGSDYLTFSGLTIVDPNTTNPATMEYGIGFFKASGTDGCQYNTVTSCTIVLSYNNNATGSGPSYEGSKGIMFINAVLGSATTTVAITAPSGANSNNTIINNAIANANYGIVFNGYADVSPFNNADNNNTISGNSIINFGGATGATNAAAGIRVNNQKSIFINNNFFNNNYLGTGAYHPSTLRGVYLQGSVNPQLISVSGNTFNVISGATTSQLSVIENAITSNTTSVFNINNNLLANCGYTTAGTSGTFYGIYNNAVGTATLNVNSNTITSISSSATGAVNVIYISGTHGMINIQNNSISNFTLATTASAYAIYNNNATPNSSVLNNTITNISKTGSGGTFYGYYNFGSPSGGNTNVSNNLISGINLTGSTAFYGIYNFTSSSQTLTSVSNTVSNITSGSGSTYGMYCYYSGNLSNNTIQNINAGGTIYGLYHLGTYSFSSNVSNNLVTNLTTTATTVYGLYISASNANSKVFSNKITNLNSSNTSALVYGAYFTASVNSFYNNIIGDLLAPAASGTNVISGIYVSSGNQNIYHNTVRLSASSSGANFGTSAIYVATTPTVLLQNNIFINNSTPAGTGITAAYRRSSTTLTTYDNSSNNNIFYAGTPSASNAIFTDGTNTYTTLAAYKTAVSPRDAASQTENTQFLSLTPSNANYLHVDGTVGSYAESGGLTVSSVSVDIDGDIRQGFPGYTGSGTAPDIGADEYNGISMAASNDVGISAFIAPATTGCYSANENVVVSIKNFGTSSQGFIPVTVWVSGAVSQTITSNYTGMLTPGATVNFTVGILNMTTAGTYSLKAFTGLTTDANTANDTLLTTRTVAPTYTLPQQVDFTAFNGSNLPSVFPGWYEAAGVTPTGTTSLWTSQTGVGTATNVTARINLYTNTRNEWIIGPKIVPTASTVLKFDAAVTNWNSTSAPDNMGSDDMVRVMVSTDCGLTYTPIYTISAANNLPPTLTPFVVSLASYSNQPIIVAFYATDGPVDDPEDYDFHLDNINIYNGTADDLAATSVSSPNTSGNCFGNENVSVVISNNGFNSATNFTVTSVLSGANTATISTTYTNTLNSFASATVNVGSVNMSNQGSYTLTTYITYPADADNSNDTIVVTYNNMVLPFPMLETFDGVSPLPGLPNGWVSDNGSASYDFTVRTTGSPAQQHGAGNPPTQGITADLWSGNATSWFETPSIGPLPNQPVELSFVYRIVNYSGYANPGGTATSYTNNDSLKVYVSSNCGSTWNLAGFINGANHTPSTAFALKLFCLGNAYAGQNIKLRFEAKWATGDYWLDIDSVKVDLAPNPVVTPSTSIVVCENQPVTLNVSGGTTYTWNPGSVTSSTFATNTSTAGVSTYTVDATLPSGCVTSEVVTLTVNPNPTLTVTASPNPVCAGNNVTLTVTGASNYTWNPGSNNTPSVVVTATAPTTYTVTGEQGGCFDVTFISLTVNPVPTATVNFADATQPSCNNGSATVTVTGGTSPYTYTWSGSASTSSVSTGLNGSGGSGTSHTVTITDANGCSVTETFTISCVTGIESMMNTGVVNIYPNPAKDVLNIVTNNNDMKHIRIMDVSGRVVLETTTNDHDIRLNINFSNGLYVLEVRTDNGVARFNVVKE